MGKTMRTGLFQAKSMLAVYGPKGVPLLWIFWAKNLLRHNREPWEWLSVGRWGRPICFIGKMRKIVQICPFRAKLEYLAGPRVCPSLKHFLVQKLSILRRLGVA